MIGIRDRNSDDSSHVIYRIHIQLHIHILYRLTNRTNRYYNIQFIFFAFLFFFNIMLRF